MGLQKKTRDGGPESRCDGSKGKTDGIEMSLLGIIKRDVCFPLLETKRDRQEYA